MNIGNCNKANTKEVIEVGLGEDFVCPECGGQLVEVPGKGPVWPYVAGVVGAAVVVAGIYFLPGMLSGNDEQVGPEKVDGETPVEVVDGVNPEEGTETAGAEETTVDYNDVPAPKTPVASVQDGQGTIDFGYAKYEGSISGGKANGLGTLTYTQSRRISKRDTKDRVAAPGDYIEGSFKDNEPVTVKWYGADKKLKGAVMIGSNGL